MKYHANFVAWIINLFLFAACAPKPVTETYSPPKEVPVTESRPHWVQSKPASSVYFYGIGVAQKTTSNSDYLEVAKKNALNDLASEISVNVSSNSILYTLERDYKFHSEFIETIKTTTNQDLEGYEIADSWESDQQYWVFYRLNRADYYAKKEAEKQAVLKNAADFFVNGKKAWNSQQVTSAFDLQLRALSVMKPYWAESNEFQIDGEVILLDNAILQELQNMANNIRLLAEPNQIKLNLANHFEATCEISAVDAISGKGLIGLPLLYRYRSVSGVQRDQPKTDSEGKVRINVENPDLQSTNLELEVAVELDKLFDPRALDAEMRQLVKGLHAPEINVPIELKRPVFYLESNEQNLHQRQKLSHLRDYLSNEIIKKGLPVSQQKNQADVIVKIHGRTRDGGQSNGFSIAYLDMNIQFIHPNGKEVYYEQSFNDVKGVSNTPERAGLKAFDNGKDKMDRSFMEKSLKAII